MLGLQASIFNSIVNKEFIKDIGLILNTLINLLILISSLIICLYLRPLRSFLISIFLASLYFILNVAVFIKFGVCIDLFLPLIIIISVYLGATFYRFLDETRKNELIEKELDIARTIQKSFLPQDINLFSGIELASFMQPAKFVAGDLYDIIKIDDKRLGILIGDVSGKGVPAALIMAQTISLFRIFALQLQSCSEVLNRLNKELYGKFSGRFVTCLYMIIDTAIGRVSVSSAGHAPVILYQKAANSILEVNLAIDVPLGIMGDTVYQDSVFSIEEGDKIAVFTDGVSEARNRDGKEFGVENVKRIMMQNSNSRVNEIEEKIKVKLAQFAAHCPQHDDITIIIAGTPVA
jgi:sigma-B regulation protein RsbU (phosphoserine phosphatase)